MMKKVLNERTKVLNNMLNLSKVNDEDLIVLWNIYLLKVKNGNTRIMQEISSNVSLWRCSGVFNVSFDDIPHILNTSSKKLSTLIYYIQLYLSTLFAG